MRDTKLFGATSDAPVTATRPRAAGTAAGAGTRARSVKTAAATGAAASPWKRVTTPNVGTNDNTLEAIAGRSPTDIWAVGTQLPNSNATIVRTLAIHYNGQTWSVVPTPKVGREASSLYGVAALPDGTAWAVGIHTRNSGHSTVSLAEHWDGHAWTVVPIPSPGSASNMLYSVAAVSDNDAWAVGGYAGADNAFHPLLEHWDGKSWSVVPVHGLSNQDGMLTSITSSPGQGVWAGGQIAMSAPDRQIVLHLTGNTWKVVSEAPVHTPGAATASAYPQAIGVTAQAPGWQVTTAAGTPGSARSSRRRAPTGCCRSSPRRTRPRRTTTWTASRQSAAARTGDSAPGDWVAGQALAVHIRAGPPGEAKRSYSYGSPDASRRCVAVTRWTLLRVTRRTPRRRPRPAVGPPDSAARRAGAGQAAR